jgi:hypothetical protein
VVNIDGKTPRDAAVLRKSTAIVAAIDDRVKSGRNR